MSVTNILTKFKTGYIQFVDELIHLFPNEPDLILMRVLLADQIPVTTVADLFITHVLPYKELIKNKDEKYFLEENSVFDLLDGGKVLHFKKLWTSSQIDADDKDVIWDFFNTFCMLVEMYKKNK